MEYHSQNNHNQPRKDKIQVKVLSVVSQKGGVGKTTISLNMSYALASRGCRTLLVDVDPQGAIGISLTQKVQTSQGLAEFIAQQKPLRSVVVATRLPQLHLVPLGQLSSQYTQQFGAALSSGVEFQRLVREAQSFYDLVIIDTPAGFNGPTVGAMRAADFALSPLQAEPIALRSISQLLEILTWLREDGHSIMLAGLVVSMWQANHPVSNAVVAELRKKFPSRALFQTMIPRDPVFLEASAAGVPLGLLSRRAPAQSMVFEQLAIEVETRLSLQQKEPGGGPMSLVD
jgi:chromosome partitioning protein